jgi:hypothetical protein
MSRRVLRALLGVLSVLAVLAGPGTREAAAQAAPPSRLLVQRFESVGVSEKLSRSLEEAVVLDVGQRKGMKVVSPAEMEQTCSLRAPRRSSVATISTSAWWRFAGS